MQLPASPGCGDRARPAPGGSPGRGEPREGAGGPASGGRGRAGDTAVAAGGGGPAGVLLAAGQLSTRRHFGAWEGCTRIGHGTLGKSK